MSEEGTANLIIHISIYIANSRIKIHVSILVKEITSPKTYINIKYRGGNMQGRLAIPAIIRNI